MGALAGRLVFDDASGEVRDGPRRYVLMRADVLMGALARLPVEVRAAMLAALADSVRDNGADSVRAYLAQARGDVDALLSAMPTAAADLGWGAWRFETSPSMSMGTPVHAHEAAGRAPRPVLSLVVRNSPFVAGWRADGRTAASGAPVREGDASSPMPVCAPIAGMLAAVASVVGGGEATDRAHGAARIDVVESHCAATHGGEECRFDAWLAPWRAVQPPSRADGGAA